MKNLIVNLWGIGNMIQMEPLMRVLGEGDVLCEANRSVHELAPLFPKWFFIPNAPLRPPYDDIYMGFPIAAMPFAQLGNRIYAQLGNRIHYPVWSFGEWTDPLYSRYVQMAGHTSTGKDGYMFNAFSFSDVKEYGAPKLSIPNAPKLSKTIAVSLGYWHGDGGAWARKNWGSGRLSVARSKFRSLGWSVMFLGKREDFSDWKDDPEVMKYPPTLLEQIHILAGCSGYLGNDTGFAHIAGALGLPSAVYTVEDKVKVQTAAPKLLQFGAETSPEKAVDWLIEAIEGGEKDGREEGTLIQEGQADPGGGHGTGA